jgi:DNA-binding beta-propeller fold protein YncE
VAPATTLAVSPHFTNVPGLPFDVVTTPDGRFTFVSSEGASGSGGGEVLVFRGDGKGASTAATVPLGNLDPAGMALADHARFLLVAASADLVVINVAKAEHGGAGAVTAEVRGAGSGAIEVAPTPDGKAAFVSMEENRQVDVFRLSGTKRPKYIGAVPVEALPVGIAFSPDGRTAYVTSEEAKSGNPNNLGTLSLLRVSVAESQPAKAVERTVVAGCAPVRVVVAPDGTVWVTARQSDAVLGFSASDLASGKPALISDVTVGAAPVGMALFDGGQRLLVADSNRFGDPRATATLAVVDLTGTPGLVGYVPAGVFPRQMTLEPGGTEVDVTNYMSSELETVPVAPLVVAAP